MKYIKEYNEEVSKMEEISEYLQEIFDKYSIIRQKKFFYPRLNGNLNLYYPEGNNAPRFWVLSVDNNDNEYIFISVDDTDLLHKINKELYDMIPQLERRSGIMLTAYIDLAHIDIRQIYRRFGKKNMYVKEEMIQKKIKPKLNKTRESYIELSDYLQEFFDKFRIVEVKPGSWKKLDTFLHNTWCLLQHKDNTPSVLGYYGDKYTKYNFKIHVHVKDDIFNDAVDEIYRIQSNIEKRMGLELKISTVEPATFCSFIYFRGEEDNVGKIAIEIR